MWFVVVIASVFSMMLAVFFYIWRNGEPATSMNGTPFNATASGSVLDEHIRAQLIAGVHGSSLHWNTILGVGKELV